MTFKAIMHINNLEKNFLSWLNKASDNEYLIIDLSGLAFSKTRVMARLIKKYFTNNQKQRFKIYYGPYIQASQLIKKYILDENINL